MDQNTQATKKKEAASIFIILILIVMGGVFYGIDIYKKAKAPATDSPSVPLEAGPAIPAGN